VVFNTRGNYISEHSIAVLVHPVDFIVDTLQQTKPTVSPSFALSATSLPISTCLAPDSGLGRTRINTKQDKVCSI